jgi:hypothetical protein
MRQSVLDASFTQLTFDLCGDLIPEPPLPVGVGTASVAAAVAADAATAAAGEAEEEAAFSNLLGVTSDFSLRAREERLADGAGGVPAAGAPEEDIVER